MKDDEISDELKLRLLMENRIILYDIVSLMTSKGFRLTCENQARGWRSTVGRVTATTNVTFVYIGFKSVNVYDCALNTGARRQQYQWFTASTSMILHLYKWEHVDVDLYNTNNLPQYISIFLKYSN